MESVLNIVANAENGRMLAIMVFGFSLYVLMRSQMKDVGHSLNKRIDDTNKRIDELRGDTNGRIDELRYNDLAAISKRIDSVEVSLNKRIDELKHNDFAHLNSTIEALTYALEKNGTLKREDKEYVDSRLAH